MNSRQKNRAKKKIISSRISYYCLDLLIASSPNISYDKAVWCNDLSVCWYFRVDSLRKGRRCYLGMFWVSFILFPFIAVSKLCTLLSVFSHFRFLLLQIINNFHLIMTACFRHNVLVLFSFFLFLNLFSSS